MTQGATACCDLVKKHVGAAYGMVGGLDECADDADAFCGGSEAERACCASAGRVLQLAEPVKARTQRDGCAVTDAVAKRIEHCARYQLAETLCALPAAQREACLDDRRSRCRRATRTSSARRVSAPIRG